MVWTVVLMLYNSFGLHLKTTDYPEFSQSMQEPKEDNLILNQ